MSIDDKAMVRYTGSFPARRETTMVTYQGSLPARSDEKMVPYERSCAVTRSRESVQRDERPLRTVDDFVDSVVSHFLKRDYDTAVFQMQFIVEDLAYQTTPLHQRTLKEIAQKHYDACFKFFMDSFEENAQCGFLEGAEDHIASLRFLANYLGQSLNEKRIQTARQKEYCTQMEEELVNLKFEVEFQDWKSVDRIIGKIEQYAGAIGIDMGARLKWVPRNSDELRYFRRNPPERKESLWSRLRDIFS